MSDEADTRTWIQITEERLTELLAKAHTSDLTEAQWEREKTERIKSYCTLIPSLQGTDAFREVMERLLKTDRSEYRINPTRVL